MPLLCFARSNNGWSAEGRILTRASQWEAKIRTWFGPRLLRVVAFASAETMGRAAVWLTLFLLPWILSPIEYGIVVLLATFEGVAKALLMLGQDRAVMWRGASGKGARSGDPWLATAVLVTALACFAGLAVVAVVGTLGGGALLGVPVWPHLVLLGVAVICVNVNRIVLAFARVASLTREFVVYRIGTGAGRLIAILGLAQASGSSLAFPIGAAVGTVVGGGRLWRRTMRGAWTRGTVDRQLLRTMVRYGAPLSLHAVAMNAVAFVDRWVIGSALGLEVVGSYAWYYMLGSAVMFLFAALSVYYEPAIYRDCQRSGSVRTLQEYLGISIALAGIYSLLGASVAPFAGGLVPDTIDGNPRIARIVLVAHWIYPIYLSSNYLLSAFARTIRVALVSGFALGIVLLANLILVPRIGAIGGAWATLAGTLTLVLAAGVILRRLRIGGRVLIAPSIVVAVLGVAGLFLPGALGLAAAAGCLTVFGIGYTIRQRGRVRAG